MARSRLLGLDALRGMAALVVVVYHHVVFFSPNILNEINVAASGPMAVDFFFILSGYVISRMMDGREYRPSSFMWQRYRRLWPVMAVGSAIGVIALLVHEARLPDLLTLVAGLALVPIFTNPGLFALNPPAWSIFYELFANLVHVLVSRRAWLLIFTLALVSLVLNGHPGSGYSPGTFWGGFDRVLVGYGLGVLLYRWWRDEPPLALSPAWAFSILVLLLPFYFYEFYFIFVFAVCPLAMAAALRWEPRWGGFAGDMSFPLYAVHAPLLVLLAPAGPLVVAVTTFLTAWAVMQIGIGKSRSRSSGTGSRGRCKPVVGEAAKPA